LLWPLSIDNYRKVIIGENTTKTAGFQGLLPHLLLIVIPNQIQLDIATSFTPIVHQTLNFIIILDQG
jgi:hypothetical protein